MRSPFLLFCITLFVPCLCAQSPRVERISIKEGLPQSFVTSILQDREGFVWAGTKSGLNRFDGRNFQIFTHSPEDTFSISDNQIWAISEHADFLLVATRARVLDFYHKKTRRFFHLPLTEGKILKSPYSQRIFVDAQQNIWLVTGEFEGLRQLCVIRVPEGFWQQLAAAPECTAGEQWQLRRLRHRHDDPEQNAIQLLRNLGRHTTCDLHTERCEQQQLVLYRASDHKRQPGPHGSL